MNKERVQRRCGSVDVVADWRERLAVLAFYVLIAAIPLISTPQDTRPTVCTGTTTPPLDQLQSNTVYISTRECEPDPTLPAPKRDVGWIDLAVVSVAGTLGVRRARCRLRFDADGVLLRNVLWTRRIAWTDLAGVTLTSVGMRGYIRGIGVRRHGTKRLVRAFGAGTLQPLKDDDCERVQTLIAPWTTAHNVSVSFDLDRRSR